MTNRFTRKEQLHAATASSLVAVAAFLVLVVMGNTARATNLVYFEEDGGGGNPRGLYNFDTATGISTLRASVGGTQRFFSLATRPSDGTIFAIATDTNSLYTMNINTGATNFVASVVDTDFVANIAFSPNSTLYGLERNNRGLFTINQTTGLRTPIGTTSDVRAGLDFSPNGRLFGLGEEQGPSSALFQIDPATAVDTFVGNNATFVQLPEDAAFSADGSMFITDFFGAIFQVNTSTGAKTLVGTTGMGTGLLGLIPVPEPPGFWLAACGAIGVITFLRITKRR